MTCMCYLYALSAQPQPAPDALESPLNLLTKSCIWTGSVISHVCNSLVPKKCLSL